MVVFVEALAPSNLDVLNFSNLMDPPNSGPPSNVTIEEIDPDEDDKSVTSDTSDTSNASNIDIIDVDNLIPTRCDFTLVRGTRKGQSCNKRVKSGSRCKYHIGK